MGTTAGARARKLEEETENFRVQRADNELGKAIMQARTAKIMTQKQLAMAVNELPSVVQCTENGSAVYNPEIVKKLERALGVRLPRPNKAPPPAKEKPKAKP